MGCCGSKQKEDKSAHQNVTSQEVQEGEGCYLAVDDKYLYCLHSDKLPEANVIAFSGSKNKIPEGRLKMQPKLLHVLQDTGGLYQGVLDYLLIAFPLSESVCIFGNALSDVPTPFMIVLHQKGNDVIGDRVLKCVPGGSAMPIDQCDAVAVVPVDCTEFDKRSQSLQKFRENVTAVQGKMTYLDDSGKVPPNLVGFC